MKKLLSLFLFLLALIISFVKPIEVKGEVEYETKSYKMLNVADSFVNGGTNADLNFGKGSQLKVRYRTDYGTNYFEFYFKFNFPANVLNVSKADLLLNFQSVPSNILSRSLTIATVGSDWSEGEGKISGGTVEEGSNAITYNTRPSALPENNSVVLTFTTTPAQYDSISIDVKELINTYLTQYAQKDTPTDISFRVYSNATANETDFNFCSKEHTNDKAHGPMLDLTMDVEKVVVEPVEIYDGLDLTSERIMNSSGKESSIHTLEIDGNSPLTVVAGVPDNITPLQPGIRQTPSGMAQAYEDDGYKALAAINGDFFKMNDEGTENLIQPRGLTIKDGQILSPRNDWTFFGIKKDGTPVIGDPTTYDSLVNELEHAVGGDSGYLVKDGVVTPTNDDAGCHSQNSVAPRTAIGIKADNSIVMVVVDGRTTESDGLVLTDLAKHMLDKGCVNAINLDGGGSSSMAIKNNNGVFAPVNKPSDAAGERPVGSGLIVIDPTKSVLSSSLKSKITEATTLMNESQYGNEIGKYPEEQKNILNIAIVNAKAALVNENKTQATIDQAVIDLQSAINGFKATKITKIFDNLNKLILDANNLLHNSTFGTDIGDYPTEQEGLLTEAIASAEGVVSNSETEQADIDAEIIKLGAVINAFKASVIVLQDEAILNKIEEATALFNSANYGTNVNEYPYEAGITLNKAINEAKTILAKENVTQKEVDDAVIMLNNSITTFNNTKILLDTEELTNLITKIEYKLEDVVFGEEIGNYDVSQETIINKALEDAKQVLTNPNATQDDITSALNNLKTKLDELNKSMVTKTNTPDEPIDPEPTPNPDPINPEKEPESNNEILFLCIGLGAGIILSLIVVFIINKRKKTV